MEGSSVNHENDYYKILKFINKTKFTFADVDNENNKELVHKCNSKHKCALCVNLKPSDSFHSSLTHRKYVTKCDDKNINTLNCSTSNCIYLITWIDGIRSCLEVYILLFLFDVCMYVCMYLSLWSK